MKLIRIIIYNKKIGIIFLGIFLIIVVVTSINSYNKTESQVNNYSRISFGCKYDLSELDYELIEETRNLCKNIMFLTTNIIDGNFKKKKKINNI